jgi:pimeloyl-ACP methyl ester carboxylesterase
VSICRPGFAALACGEGEGAQPGARATNNAVVALNAATRRCVQGCLLAGLIVGGNVQHNLEFQQRRASRHGVGPVTGMGFDGRPLRPRLECFIGLPLGHHEVAVFTLDRTQQLKAEETGLVLHRVRAMGEPLLQLRASVGGYLNCVDLHHWHLARLPRPPACPTPGRPTQDGRMPGDLLTCHGGRGAPLVLVHGLMGRGTTWSRQLPWLTRLGTVYTHDALWHRGRDVDDPHPISTERFVADLADAVSALGTPARMVGHSMGALHSWCLAAERPDLVSALVVEDMAPDFRGRTTGPWEPWLHALPVEFGSAQEVFDEFGPIAGQYFLDAFDRTATGWRLHGHTSRWIEIAAEWGTRDYWSHWQAARAPALLIEAGNSVTPPGQMRAMTETSSTTTYLAVQQSGHLIHDEAPQVYREAVESFIAGLDS